MPTVQRAVELEGQRGPLQAKTRQKNADGRQWNSLLGPVDAYAIARGLNLTSLNCCDSWTSESVQEAFKSDPMNCQACPFRMGALNGRALAEWPRSWPRSV